MARDYRVPPTRYLGLPWREWGETDYLLTQAFDLAERLTCGCGCGQLATVCRDEKTAGRWQVNVTVCHAGAAMDEFRAAHADEAEPGQLAWVELLPEGVEPVDPLVFDEARARREYDEHMARFAD